MAAGGSFDVMAEKEANMEGTKKMRGAWVIRVKGGNAGQDTGAEYSLASNNDTPHCNEQRNATDEKEE